MAELVRHEHPSETRCPYCRCFLVRILLAAAVTGLAGSQAYRLASRLYVPYPPAAAAGIASPTTPLFTLRFVGDDAVNIMWRMAVVSATMSTTFLLAVTALCGRRRSLWRSCLFLLNLGFLVGAMSGMIAFVAGGYFAEFVGNGGPADVERVYRDICVGAIAWLPVGGMLALAAGVALEIPRGWVRLVAGSIFGSMIAALLYPFLAAVVFPLHAGDGLFPTGAVNQFTWTLLPALGAAIAVDCCLPSCRI